MYGILEGFPGIIDVLIAWVKVLKENMAVVNFYIMFRCDGLVIMGVCVKMFGWCCLFASLGA